MTRDYKSRVNERRAQGRLAAARRLQFDRHSGNSSISLWKWMLITGFIISFVVLVVYLSTGSKPAPEKAGDEKAEISKEEPKPETKQEPKLPQFDFYTILPEKEVVVPEYEIETRMREEQVGKAKNTQYIMQAGSFMSFKEADQLRARLASMGIESKVQKAKVGNVNWYRVKLGPFTQTASVNAIRSRLRHNGIDVVITEVGH
ncbi:MAG: SPOR domain-containing protein [Methylococcales bacterium]|nr:SPOR domain-containing protein [Methylococcales bacterium]